MSRSRVRWWRGASRPRRPLAGQQWRPRRFWAALAAASRNALGREELSKLWEEARAREPDPSPARDYARFFEEHPEGSTAIRIHCGGEKLALATGEVFEHD